MKLRKNASTANAPRGTVLQFDSDTYKSYYKNRFRNESYILTVDSYLYRLSFNDVRTLVIRNRQTFEHLRRRIYMPQHSITRSQLRKISRRLFFENRPIVAFGLIQQFVQAHPSKLPFTKSKCFKEAKEHIAEAAKFYENRILSENEKQLYRSLTAIEKAAFRLLRSFAYKKAEGKYPNIFFISLNELQRRLLLKHPEDAQRLMRYCCEQQFIAIHKKGLRFNKRTELPRDRRGNIITAHSTQYEWRLEAYCGNAWAKKHIPDEMLDDDDASRYDFEEAKYPDRSPYTFHRPAELKRR